MLTPPRARRPTSGLHDVLPTQGHFFLEQAFLYLGHPAGLVSVMACITIFILDV
jgi:hypothetical protein